MGLIPHHFYLWAHIYLCNVARGRLAVVLALPVDWPRLGIYGIVINLQQGVKMLFLTSKLMPGVTKVVATEALRGVDPQVCYIEKNYSSKGADLVDPSGNLRLQCILFFPDTEYD